MLLLLLGMGFTGHLGLFCLTQALQGLFQHSSVCCPLGRV